MSSTTTLRTVLVAVDYSENSKAALTKALELGGARPDANLHVIHVVEGPPPVDHRVWTPISELGLELDEARLHELVSECVSDFERENATRVLGFETHVVRGDAAEQITRLAVDIDADLLLIGAHAGHWFLRRFIGSVTEHLVRTSPCPVMVVPALAVENEAPQLAPACPRCIEARRASQGRELWCEDHQHHHGRRHTFHQGDRNDQAHSSNSLLIRTWGYGA
jgi:nucleotide-binding universal stress UspA family protein